MSSQGYRTRGKVIRSSDLIRAARLDGTLYEEVKANTTSTVSALGVVVLVALAHGAGGFVRAVAFKRDPPAEGFLIGVQGEIVFWVGSSFAIYLIGRYLLGSAATYGQVLRPVGFAAVPGLLIFVAALASLVGAQVVVFAVLVPWRLATSFVAVERALEVGRPKSAVALLLGVVCGLVLVELGTVTLLNVLA
jgi:hypothetical protein